MNYPKDVIDFAIEKAKNKHYKITKLSEGTYQIKITEDLYSQYDLNSKYVEVVYSDKTTIITYVVKLKSKTKSNRLK
jgi:hypothetical protein